MAIFPSFDKTINFASLEFKASFNLFLNKIFKGTHSLSLWGPWDGFVAQIPPTLDNNQCFGALILFKCFLGPLCALKKFKKNYFYHLF